MDALIEYLNLWGERAVNFAWPMLWQSSVLIAVLFAFDYAFRRRIRASVRYALWLVVLMKLLLPPSLALPTSLAWWVRPPATVVAPAKPEPTTTFLVAYRDVMPATVPIFSQPVTTTSPRPSLSTAGWAVLNWIAISLGLLAWLLVRWWQVAREVRRSTSASERLNDLLTKAQNETGDSRRVELRVTTRAISPAVCGLIRPVILLPQSLVARLTPEQLRAVLLHELIHLRRGDVWVNCLQALLQIVYWWHPLLWLANARIRRVREEAVDDAVMLAMADDADTYAPTLLEVAKLAFNRPLASLGLVGILESRSGLRQRIERLVDFRPPQKAGLTIASTLCVLAFAVLAVPMERESVPIQHNEPLGPDTQADQPQAITNVANLSKGRQRIIEKLENIRLGVVVYTGATLASVVRDLNDEAKLRDPEGRGINFIINPSIEPPVQWWLDRTNQLPSAETELLDVKSLLITIDPPLSDVKLAYVMDAIVTGSNNQLEYSIEDYAVVFSRKGPEPDRHYTRTFKFDPNRFYTNLVTLGFLEAMPAETPPPPPTGPFRYITITNSMQAVSIAVQRYFLSLGVNLDPKLGKAIFWSDRSGMLYVRATMQDLDSIDQALRGMPLVSTEATPARTNRINSPNLRGGRGEAAVLIQDARVLFGAGKWDEAEAELKKALNIDPDNRAANYYLGLVQERRSGVGDEAQLFGIKSLTNGLFDAAFRKSSDDEVPGARLSLSRKVGLLFQVEVQEDGSYRMGSTPVTLSELKARLAETKQANPDVAVHLNADKKAPFKSIVALVELLKELRVPSITAHTQGSNSTSLFDRNFKVDPSAVQTNLRKQGYLAGAPTEQRRGLIRQPQNTNTSEEIAEALSKFFSKAGVSLGPPRSLSFNDRNGTLAIRATVQEFSIVEQALSFLSAKPNPQIKIEVRFVELTQEDTRALGFDWFLGNLLIKDRVFTNSAGTAPAQVCSILTDPQYRVVLRALEQRSGVDLLSAPSVRTLSGRQAQIQIAHEQTVVTGLNPQALIPPGITGRPDDTSQLYQTNAMRFGPVLDVTPQLSADGYTISMAVVAAVLEFLGYAENSNSVSAYVNGQRKQMAWPVPKFRSREMTATANVWDGQTVVLFNPLEYVTWTKSDGEPEAQEVTGSNKKPLLVFVTARLVDEAGNPIHADDEMPFAKGSIPAQTPSQK